MRNNSSNVMNWRNRTKEKLVLYKGGKCEKCGYNNLNYLRVFEFHHTGEHEKDFTISGKSWSYEKLQAEVDKCILLCSNCHKETHEDLDRPLREKRLDYVAPSRRDTSPGWRSRTTKRPCEFCGEETVNRRFCNIKCSSSFQSKTYAAVKPTNEELLELKQQYNNIQIGKMFGVSEATIRTWVKRCRAPD